MPSASPRSREWYQSQYTKLSYSTNITAAGTTENVLAAKNANYQIFVQAIELAPTTAAVETVTWQDDAGTPVPIAKYTGAAANTTPYLADFGPEGFPLTTGTNLDMVVSAGGALRAAVHIEGYQKLAVVISSTAGASLQ